MLPADWAAAVAAGVYPWSTRGVPVAEIGFVHCSTWRQIEGVAAFVFPGEVALELLVVDPARLDAEVRFENLEGGRDLFPHIYGPLQMDAVVEVVRLNANTAGKIWLPERRR